MADKPKPEEKPSHKQCSKPESHSSVPSTDSEEQPASATGPVRFVFTTDAGEAINKSDEVKRAFDEHREKVDEALKRKATEAVESSRKKWEDDARKRPAAALRDAEKFERYVPAPPPIDTRLYRNPFVEVQANEKARQTLARKLRAKGDQFTRWAYADRTRRRHGFDANEFIRQHANPKEAEGIVIQTLIQGNFVFTGIGSVEDLDDSIEEARQRFHTVAGHGSLKIRRPTDNVYTMKFTEQGLANARVLVWRTGRITRHLSKKRVRIVLAILTFLVGTLTDLKSIWQFVKNPVGYFADDEKKPSR